MSVASEWGARAAPRRRWRLAAAGAGAVLLLSAPVWGPPLLSQLSFFRVRRVEVQGVHYLSSNDVVGWLRIDTTMSVWDDLEALERRVEAHAQVRTVDVGRRLPGTLVVRVAENLPVAFVPSRDGLRAFDARGRPLPIDPSRTSVDLPVVARGDTLIFRLLADVREQHPELFARISEVRRNGRGELAMDLASVLVRAMDDLSAARLADIIPVESDLARRRARAVELDLRYRDQVIARVQ